MESGWIEVNSIDLYYLDHRTRNVQIGGTHWDLLHLDQVLADVLLSVGVGPEKLSRVELAAQKGSVLLRNSTLPIAIAFPGIANKSIRIEIETRSPPITSDLQYKISFNGLCNLVILGNSGPGNSQIHGALFTPVIHGALVGLH